MCHVIYGYVASHMNESYGVATIGRLLKIIGL